MPLTINASALRCALHGQAQPITELRKTARHSLLKLRGWGGVRVFVMQLCSMAAALTEEKAGSWEVTGEPSVCPPS